MFSCFVIKNLAETKVPPLGGTLALFFFFLNHYKFSFRFFEILESCLFVLPVYCIISLQKDRCTHVCVFALVRRDQYLLSTPANGHVNGNERKTT